MAATALLAVVRVAAPASAHVEIDPAQVPPSTFGTYTLSVPNETSAHDTLEVGVRIPSGFLVEDAQAVPGWQTVVSRAPNGVITAVTWRGGRYGPHTFAEFSLRGRSPSTPGRLTFLVTQRYDDRVVRWSGTESSETPAPVVLVGRAVATPASTATDDGQVPAAPAVAAPAAAAAVAKDAQARSRADLALALTGALVLGGAGAATILVLRRRSGG
jgi:uncharacterized protein YcnI